MVVSKLFEDNFFHLPMGRGQRFLLSYVSRQGWARHWAAGPQFPSSCFELPFYPQKKVKCVGSIISTGLGISYRLCRRM